MADYYEILGVSRERYAAEIQKAYRKSRASFIPTTPTAVPPRSIRGI